MRQRFNNYYTTMKNLNLRLHVAAFAAAFMLQSAGTELHAQTFTERLSRGVVALPASATGELGGGNFVSWRFLATDAKGTTFNLLRDGEMIAQGMTGATCFNDKEGTPTSRYSVQTVVGGSVTETSDEVQAWAQPYLSVPLIRPLDQTMPDGQTCSYTPNDCSAADVDGDGDYEIILKWDPSNSHDNSHNGYSGEVYLDCYKKEGILMWRVSLGKNIRAGAHYTQFMVYDFDGDGKAELICKTAPGSKDGKGNYVSEAATDPEILNADNEADYRGKFGHVLEGPEYLTVFSGKDGHAIHTTFYRPNRAFGVGGSPEYATEGWGDHNPGNRGERYLACVAFLGGAKQNPSAVMCRGYYTRSYLWAVDFDGQQLKTRWLHQSITPNDWLVTDAEGNTLREGHGLEATAFGQGAHSVAVGDVDGDGCDEITYGSAALDHDGSLLYSTGLGHGDAQHLSDLDPDRPGLEYYMVLESGRYGANLRDARTGEILFRSYDKQDTGRGISADIDAAHRGSEFWCSAEKKVYDIKGNVIAETEGWTPQNFRIYWDGDLQDELIGNGGRGMKPGTWGNSQGDRQRNRGEFGGRRGRGGQRGGFGQRGEGRQGPGGWNMPDSIRERFSQMPPDSVRQMMQRMMQGQQFRQDYYIAKWNGSGVDHVSISGKENLSDWGNSSSCNGTKATPCLQADLFGDWREEIILYDASDRSHLNIFTTNIPTEPRITTLMHDHIYRMGVAWQNVSYNQPPHLSYYMADVEK